MRLSFAFELSPRSSGVMRAGAPIACTKDGNKASTTRFQGFSIAGYLRSRAIRGLACDRLRGGAFFFRRGFGPHRREAETSREGAREPGPERLGGARIPLTRSTGGATHEQPKPIPLREALRSRGIRLSAPRHNPLSRDRERPPPLGAVWACSALWSLLTALSCVLWRGFRGGDWTAFHRYELPDGREEDFEWPARTGRYAWRRELEE